MRFEIEISEEARSQLQALPKSARQNIGHRLTRLQEGFSGDVKKLAARDAAYRLRVGSYRVLFKLDGNVIRVYSVKDRKDAYA
jgi:mRNA interferase RelE/StbE